MYMHQHLWQQLLLLSLIQRDAFVYLLSPIMQSFPVRSSQLGDIPPIGDGGGGGVKGARFKILVGGWGLKCKSCVSDKCMPQAKN